MTDPMETRHLVVTTYRGRWIIEDDFGPIIAGPFDAREDACSHADRLAQELADTDENGKVINPIKVLYG